MREYKIDNYNKMMILTFDYDAELIKVVKKASISAHWNSELKYWAIPVSEYSVPNIVKIIKDYGFTPAKDKDAEIEPYDYSVSEERMEKLRAVCDLRQFTYSPRPYQFEALNYSLLKQNLIIGDDVGLGKTFEAIMYAEAVEAFPCIVIVPASVKEQWAEKWAEIVGAGKRTISVIDSKETKNRKNNWKADIVIINYDIIGKKKGRGATINFSELVSTKWKMAIFDEGHFLKSSKSQRTKAAFKIVKAKMKVLILTGTATMNKPEELWNLLKLVGAEEKIAKDWKTFTIRYCAGHQSKYGWKSGGATNTLELNQKLRETCYIRREKRDVLSEMPPVTKQVFKTPIDNEKEYRYAELDFIDYIEETKGLEKAEKAQEAENLVAIGVMRQLAIAGKLKAIEQYLKDWKEAENGKLVIYGLHREPLEYLSKKFNSKLIAGGVSSKEKSEIVKGFQTNDDTFLFGNMISAGTGIDGLQKVCSNMLIIELPWRPSDLEQVVGRLDRSGQELPVTVTFMLADKTIDWDMWEMLADKESITEAVNKGIDVVKSSSGMKFIMKSVLRRKKEEQ